jgi:periplasmic protein TonB
MKIRIAILLAAGILAGCATRIADTPVSHAPGKSERNAELSEHASSASTLDGYKRDLALRISQVNSSKVYSERPQALLRSVIVLRYAIDARGHLVRSEIMRSNRDRETESTALASLRNSAPFPKPAAHLLRRGQLELSETWLFNNDGRFQLRTVALPQMDQ